MFVFCKLGIVFLWSSGWERCFLVFFYDEEYFFIIVTNTISSSVLLKSKQLNYLSKNYM